MGRYVFKPDKGVDFYVLYSTVVDLPVFWGTRKKMLKYSKKNWDGDLWVPKTRDLDKADREESELIEDGKIVWLQSGELPLSKVREACKLLDKGFESDDPRLLALLDREGWLPEDED